MNTQPALPIPTETKRVYCYACHKDVPSLVLRLGRYICFRCSGLIVVEAKP